MSFSAQIGRPFSRVNIELVTSGQNGVYGIYKQGQWLYVGKGDIRQRLLDHINGDVPGLLVAGPTHWVAEVVVGDPSAREKQLIVELNPSHNRRIG